MQNSSENDAIEQNKLQKVGLMQKRMIHLGDIKCINVVNIDVKSDI